MVSKLAPNFGPALRDIHALQEKSLESPDIAKGFDKFAKTGLPLLVCEIDQVATETTGNLVFTYKLSDHLQVCITAVGTRKVYSEKVGVDHS